MEEKKYVFESKESSEKEAVLKETVTPEKKKTRMKEFFGLGDAEPETELGAEEPVTSILEPTPVSGVNTQWLYKMLLKYAKGSKIPSSRAMDLVENVLGIFYDFCESGYTIREKTIFVRFIQMLNKKLGR